MQHTILNCFLFLLNIFELSAFAFQTNMIVPNKISSIKSQIDPTSLLFKINSTRDEKINSACDEKINSACDEKINSACDGKIKYTVDLNNLYNCDLTDTYTIIGTKTNSKCDYIIKRLMQFNKKFIFIDEMLYEKNSMKKIIKHFDHKQKINLKNIKQPWLFYETTYIKTNEMYRHLLWTKICNKRLFIHNKCLYMLFILKN